MQPDEAAPEPPWPLASGALARTFEREAQGWSFRRALEALLLELDDAQADLLQLVLREGRGAWLAELESRGGRALLAGNALSGTVTALALQGFEVDLLDPVPERARFAAFRAREQTPQRVRSVAAPEPPYRLLVLEDGAPARARLAGLASLLEPEGELVLVADNRLGYKRSLGRKGEFRVPDPLTYARLALFPAHGERTLAGHRRELAAAGLACRASYSLYPHRLDFSHVVALERAHPALTIGPMERKNRLKLAGKALGLFPLLTPSFALIARRRDAPGATAPRRTRLDRALAALGERLGTPAPEVESIVATRGNSAVVHTRGAARWTLHVPLAPKNVPQTERHLRALRGLRARFPGFPVPEPHFWGTLEGLCFSCEERLPGWTAPQACGDRPRLARMLRDVAELLPRLVVRPARRFDDHDFEQQVAARLRLVAGHAAVPGTIAALEALLERLRGRLIGRSLPLVYYHADLRGKHVQVDAEGRVLGLLDWGTAEEEGLPYFDLLQLVVHEIKQARGLSVGEAWRRLRARAIGGAEREALDIAARAFGLDAETVEALEELYPVLVAAMAEKNWDYSRPRWLHRQFGI